jgi:two-component system, sensor histidine kinase and response regulator
MAGTSVVGIPAGADARLLVVDDEPGVRETLSAVLRHQGYEVHTAGGVAEAVSRLQAASYDAVLTDLHLDDADGVEVLDELRARAPGAIIIMLTGYATLEPALRALHAGAYAYLVKPTDVEELRLTVARGLERQRLERELARRVAELEEANAAIHDFNFDLQSQIHRATDALQLQIAALDAANRELRQTQEQHERFVAMVAHELRNPLGLVMSYAQLATRPEATREAIGRYAEEIFEASMRLNRLVEDLQTATRLSTGHFDLRREPCYLASDVEAAVEQLRTTTPSRRFIFHNQPDVGLAEVDRDRILQAVRNLLDNAVKYSIQDGAIEVRVWGDDDRVFMSVRDEGAGIPEADMERILRPFERGTATADIPGSGLGLYITRGIVKAHSGELTVMNGSGPERARGAIFTISLPRSAP